MYKQCTDSCTNSVQTMCRQCTDNVNTKMLKQCSNNVSIAIMYKQCSHNVEIMFQQCKQKNKFLNYLFTLFQHCGYIIATLFVH